MLFFISRSDELGIIIAWLASKKGGSFSGCGDLLYSDFIFLCEQALIRKEDYCDYQLVSCFKKLESLDETAISILHKFFNRNDSYTRRVVLHTFAHFALPQTIDLAVELWNTDDCEFAKLDCLEALKKFSEAKPLFNTYLKDYQNLFNINACEYRRSNILYLTSENDT